MTIKQLEPYQVEGVQWCKTMESKKKTGFLCDEMGLGKTIQMCALIKDDTIGTINKKTLVCCMLNNVQHWKSELKDYVGITVFDPPRKFDGPVPSNVRVVVVPYSIFQRQTPQWIYEGKWHRVIFDEGHVASNTKTKLHEALSLIKATARWVLTATPMQNKQKEIMAMAQGLLKIKATSVKDVLDGHYLRRTHEVEEEKLPPLNAIIQVLEFTYPEERALYELVQDLYARRLDVDAKNRARLMEGIIRLRQASIHPVLFFNGVRGLKRKASKPPTALVKSKKKSIVSLVESEEHQETQEIQKDNIDEFAFPITEDIDKDLEDIEWNKIEEELAGMCDDVIPVELQRYREGLESMKGVPVIDSKSLVNGIDEIPPTEFLYSTKMDWLIKDISDNVATEKMVIFHTFVEELKIVQDLLKAKGISSLQYIGTMSREEKEKALTSFEMADVPVILMQIKCGGTGINLQVASRVYITCPNYNPCTDMQALGRVYRKGQTKEVTAIRIVMKGTVEERCSLGESGESGVFKKELRKEEAAFIVGGR